jgi:hypothetical protein
VNNNVFCCQHHTTYKALSAVAGILAREHLVYWELGAFDDLPVLNSARIKKDVITSTKSGTSLLHKEDLTR